MTCGYAATVAFGFGVIGGALAGELGRELHRRDTDG